MKDWHKKKTNILNKSCFHPVDKYYNNNSIISHMSIDNQKLIASKNAHENQKATLKL